MPWYVWLAPIVGLAFGFFLAIWPHRWASIATKLIVPVLWDSQEKAARIRRDMLDGRHDFGWLDFYRAKYAPELYLNCHRAVGIWFILISSFILLIALFTTLSS